MYGSILPIIYHKNQPNATIRWVFGTHQSILVIFNGLTGRRILSPTGDLNWELHWNATTSHSKGEQVVVYANDVEQDRMGRSKHKGKTITSPAFHPKRAYNHIILRGFSIAGEQSQAWNQQVDNKIQSSWQFKGDLFWPHLEVNGLPQGSAQPRKGHSWIASGENSDGLCLFTIQSGALKRCHCFSRTQNGSLGVSVVNEIFGAKFDPKTKLVFGGKQLFCFDSKHPLIKMSCFYDPMWLTKN